MELNTEAAFEMQNEGETIDDEAYVYPLEPDRPSPPPPAPEPVAHLPSLEDDEELARQLQAEENEMFSGPMPPAELEPPPLSPSPAPVTPPPELENDASFARALQEEEDARFKERFTGAVSKRRSKKPVAGVMESHDPTDDVYAGYGYSALDPSPGKALSELPGFYHQESDQPRAKTPPPATPTDDGDKAEKISCQFCNELIPFEEIMEHQVSEWSAAVGEGEGGRVVSQARVAHHCGRGESELD